VSCVLPLASVGYEERHAAAGRFVAGTCALAALATVGPFLAGASRNALANLRAGGARVVDRDWTIASALADRGVRPGDRVAVVANVVDVAWPQRVSLGGVD